MEKINAALLSDQAKLPARKHPHDAGIDFYSAEEKEIPPHAFGTVRTGVTIEIPAGFVGLMMPKSRSNFLLGAGVIDAEYQGEIMVKVANLTDQPLAFHPGDPVGQLLLVPIVTPEVVQIPVEQIHTRKTERGNTGGILEGYTDEKL